MCTEGTLTAIRQTLRERAIRAAEIMLDICEVPRQRKKREQAVNIIHGDAKILDWRVPPCHKRPKQHDRQLKGTKRNTMKRLPQAKRQVAGVVVADDEEESQTRREGIQT